MAGAGAVGITATTAAMVIAAAIDTAGVATAIGEAGTLLVALAVDMAEALGTAASAVGTAEADGAKIRSASSSPFQPNLVEGALFCGGASCSSESSSWTRTRTDPRTRCFRQYPGLASCYKQQRLPGGTRRGRRGVAKVGWNLGQFRAVLAHITDRWGAPDEDRLNKRRSRRNGRKMLIVSKSKGKSRLKRRLIGKALKLHSNFAESADRGGPRCFVQHVTRRILIGTGFVASAGHR